MLTRDRTDTLFRLHARNQGLGISTLERLGEYTYRMALDGQEFYVLVLSRSWDYWEYRLAFSAPLVSLIVCSKHDTCLPISVLEIGSSGYRYGPRELPKDAPALGSKRTKRTARMFLGALLSGDQQAFDALERMHLSSQKRYRRRLSALLTEKRGGHQLSVLPALQAVS